MLRYFLEDMHTIKGEPMDNRGLFEGLNIMQAGESYLSHMGAYPVITLTLKAGRQSTFASAYRQITIRSAWSLNGTAMCWIRICRMR